MDFGSQCKVVNKRALNNLVFVFAVYTSALVALSDRSHPSVGHKNRDFMDDPRIGRTNILGRR